MSEYSERLLVEKLSKLLDTQESITQTSFWMTHHRLHAQASVSTWMRELKRASSARKMSFLYLANDVVQTSRKKGEELPREFAKILPDAFIHVYRTCPPESQNKVLRILQIWEDRAVYPAEFLIGIRKSLKTPENGLLKTEIPSRRSGSSSSSTSLLSSSANVLQAEIRPLGSLYMNIEKQQAIVTDMTIQISKMPSDWLQQDLAALYQESSQRVEAISMLEDARKKLQTRKAALSNEINDRQALVAELIKLQQANDLSLKGLGTAETENETQLAIVDIQLNNVKHALESSSITLLSSSNEELPTISPILPITSNHQGTPELLTTESNSSVINNNGIDIRHSVTPPRVPSPSAAVWSGAVGMQDGLLSGDLSNTDLTNWGS